MSHSSPVHRVSRLLLILGAVLFALCVSVAEASVPVGTHRNSRVAPEPGHWTLHRRCRAAGPAGLHHQDRIEVPPKGMPVSGAQQNPDDRLPCTAERLHGMHGLQTTDEVHVKLIIGKARLLSR